MSLPLKDESTQKANESTGTRKKRSEGQSTPPDTYHVTAIVHPTGNPDLELNVDMPNIPRSDILAPDYPAKGIQAVVRQFESICYRSSGELSRPEASQPTPEGTK